MDLDKSRTLLKDFFCTRPKLEFKRRAVIIGEGEESDAIYYIDTGHVKVCSTTKSGEEKIHYIYGPGDLFPMTHIFSVLKFELAFIAFGHSVIYKTTMDEFNRHVNKHPYCLLALLHQQTIAMNHIVNLNLSTANSRVAYRLQALAKRFGEPYVDDMYKINMTFTIQELSEGVRLSRETTGKVIAEFEKNGIINFGRHQILVDMKKIEALASD